MFKEIGRYKDSVGNWKIQRGWSRISQTNPYLQRGFDTVREYVRGNGDGWKGLFLVFGDFDRNFFYSDLSDLEANEARASMIMERKEMQKGNGAYLRKLNGDWANFYKQIEETHGKGLLWMDSPLGDLYDEMSHQRDGTDHDGAIVFNPDGKLYGAQMFVNGSNMDLVPEMTIERIREIKDMEDDIGTKHVAAAYASRVGLPSVIGSEDAKTVIGFYRGFIPEALIYVPESRT